MRCDEKGGEKLGSSEWTRKYFMNEHVVVFVLLKVPRTAQVVSIYENYVEKAILHLIAKCRNAHPTLALWAIAANVRGRPPLRRVIRPQTQSKTKTLLSAIE